MLGANVDTRLTVVGGTLAELLDFASAWPKVEANLHTQAGKESLHVTLRSGPLQRLLALRDLPLQLQATLPAIPFTATGRITLGDGGVAIDQISAQAGKPDAKDRLQLRWRDRPAWSADLGSRLIDSTQWWTGTPDGVSVLDRPIAVKVLLSPDQGKFVLTLTH